VSVVAEPLFSLLATRGRFPRVRAWLGFDAQLQQWAPQGARVATYLFVAWLTPFVLAACQGPRPGAISFVGDFETHLRSLVAIPLLLFAESQVDPEVRYVVRALASPRRCRRPDELLARVRSLHALVEHPLALVMIVGLAFLAVPPWIRLHTAGHETWIFRAGVRPTLTAAGTWQAYVVVPIYMFLLLRWTWRWIVLALVYARSAPLLRPIVSHADRCGGFSFVSDASARFAWVVAAVSSLVSARWLFAIIREGAPAKEATRTMVAVLVLGLVVAFFPLLGFAFHFARAKRSGLRRYRAVLEGHARNVERAWYRRPYPAHVTSEESSSLTDLNSIYECVRAMRIIPYRRKHLVAVALAAVVPMLPVVPFIVPIDEVLRGVFQALL
jgi:hypothetical protein